MLAIFHMIMSHMLVVDTGAREPGGAIAPPPPTFCLNGMDMPVPP